MEAFGIIMMVVVGLTVLSGIGLLISIAVVYLEITAQQQ